jgi:hypothetical protein
MSNGTKRTLAELITLHELEPELSEVITEGRVDAALLLWFLRRQGSDAAVYSVSDRLDVPPNEVKRRGQNLGNKGRVIASAMKVEEESVVATQKITFVYDIDDDLIVGRPILESPCLTHTDYRSIEMYCFAEKPIDKMLRVRLRAPEDVKASQVIAAIREPLISIALARLVLSRIDPPIALVIAIERRCHLKGEAMLVDIRALILDSVAGAGGAQRLGITIDSLISEQEREASASFAEVRLVIRGHDFTRVCCYYLKTRYPGLFKEDRLPYRTPNVFEGTLMTCLEFEDLAQEGLFKKLLERHDRG